MLLRYMKDNNNNYDKHMECMNKIEPSEIGEVYKFQDDEETCLESEYVILDPDVTDVFFTNTLRLWIASTGKEVSIQKDIVKVGQDSAADLPFADSQTISHDHATFYFENSKWYLRDNGSEHGTRLNGVRLLTGKKYQLAINDTIEFAMTEKVIFYQYSEEDFRERVLADYENSKATNKSDKYIGTVIAGRYHVDALLARSFVFTNYLVLDEKLRKVLTMKVWERANGSGVAKESIIREAVMMKNLAHPLIPEVVDFIEEEDSVLVFREYVEGETLEQIVQRDGAQPAEKVIEWAKEICEMLTYLHSRNPAHIYRDMKPSNVLLTTEQRIKVIDFGIVRMYDPEKTKDTYSLGTIGYAAPEQYGSRQSDARTDIFGLGMTMHHLVTGEDPKMPGYQAVPICRINPELPKGLEYIISKCIEPNPDDRYQSGTELLKDLNDYKSLPRRKSIADKLFAKKR